MGVNEIKRIVPDMGAEIRPARHAARIGSPKVVEQNR
jgi:hypothetical protein